MTEGRSRTRERGKRVLMEASVTGGFCSPIICSAVKMASDVELSLSSGSFVVVASHVILLFYAVILPEEE